MKVDLGHGAYLEPDEGPRNTAFHKRIVKSAPIATTRSGYFHDLECGHRVMTFGNLEHVNGVILCTACRDGEATK
jgi:hypothetical protein